MLSQWSYTDKNELFSVIYLKYFPKRTLFQDNNLEILVTLPPLENNVENNV